MASLDSDRGSDDTRRQAPLNDQQRELANQAMQEFERGNYNQCSTTMGRLADARPTDVKVVLNRAVALFYQSNCKAIDEFRHNIQTVFNMVILYLIIIFYYFKFSSLELFYSGHPTWSKKL